MGDLITAVHSLEYSSEEIDDAMAWEQNYQAFFGEFSSLAIEHLIKNPEQLNMLLDDYKKVLQKFIKLQHEQQQIVAKINNLLSW